MCVQNLAHEGGFVGFHHPSRPTTARTGGPGISSRSQTVPSIDLRNALDEIHREAHQRDAQQATSRLATLQSGTPYLQDLESLR